MKTRVALMSMRPRLRDILTDALAREPDVDLLNRWTDLDVGLPAPPPDVLVLESPDPLDPAPATRLLRALPDARVLVVADSGDHAALFEMRVTQTVMRTVGIGQVIAAIRYGFGGVQPELAPGPGGQGVS
jgi:DNA-binding NarL/FixJ family response regulator